MPFGESSPVEARKLAVINKFRYCSVLSQPMPNQIKLVLELLNILCTVERELFYVEEYKHQVVLEHAFGRAL